MVQKTSWFNVLDNSGITAVMCLQAYGSPRIRLGHLLLSVVKRQIYGRRDQRKRFYFCIVLLLKKRVFRKSGAYYCRFLRNGVLLLDNDKEQLMATRFFTPIPREVKRTKFREICQFSRLTV